MPARRLGKHPNAKIYVWRRIILVIAVIVTLSFAGKIVLGFFSAEYVSLELSGNMHYTDVQIYDVLGEKLENIVTASEEQTARYLKENLSYIKEVHVVKHVMKRVLTIEVTEREPFALLGVSNAPQADTLKAHTLGNQPFTVSALRNGDISFFLVDSEGHVLKTIEVKETGQWRSEGIPEEMVILSVVSNELPRIGTIVQSSEVQLGLALLKTVLLQEPALAAQIRIIDANDFQKIQLQIDALPIPVWLAGDALESGLHHTALLLKQHRTQILELIGKSPSAQKPYLDVRYQDTLYLGGYAKNR
ncbi:MAG: FtsQ-type POTRA domain-containing protein [Candidatus Poribacteria bacterium]|nr:FtsQ-type POTRA domain-containing protein [Candidatus Poribacteria bacterium]